MYVCFEYITARLPSSTDVYTLVKKHMYSLKERHVRIDTYYKLCVLVSRRSSVVRSSDMRLQLRI